MMASINHLNGGIDERSMSHRAAAYANLVDNLTDECMEDRDFNDPWLLLDLSA